MAKHEAQKAEKLTAEDVARRKLDGDFLREFNEFLEFCKEEKIRLPWKSINGFKMVYRGKTIGGLTLGAEGWLDDNIEASNCVVMHIGTAEKDDYDAYLRGQPDEIAGLFLEQIGHKCVHCRPTCGCSKVSGRTISVSGQTHDNVCMNAPGFKFVASGGMQSVVLCTPRALYPPEPVREVTLDMVKGLVRAKKGYVDNSLM